MKKIISILLLLSTLVSLSSVCVFAENSSTGEKYPGWAEEAIAYVTKEGIMNGMENGFQPNTVMSRAMVVTVLCRYAGERAPYGYENPFIDVEKGGWYYNGVLWASYSGVVNGRGDGIFDPDGSVTREEFVTILYRFADKIECLSVEYGRSSLIEFADRGDISSWAREAVKWAHADRDDFDGGIYDKNAIIAGYLSGGESLLKPDKYMTRAEFAAMFYRYATSDIPTKREIFNENNSEPEYDYVGKDNNPSGENFTLKPVTAWTGWAKYSFGAPVNIKTEVMMGSISAHSSVSAGIEIIHSYGELQLCLSEARPEANGDKPGEYLKKYTEDFFDDKVLVIVDRAFGSGELRFRLNGAVKSGDELCLNMTTEIPRGLRPAVMAYTWQVYEMDKSALNDIKTISLYAGLS